MMREAFAHWLPISVRWADMDAFNHVNNAAYFTYLESGRVAYFDELDLWRLHQPGIAGPALVTATCNFRAQVRYPADLEVGTRVSQVRARSFEIEATIVRLGTDEIVADGTCVTVWMDYRAGKAIALPPEAVTAIRAFEDRVSGP